MSVSRVAVSARDLVLAYGDRVALSSSSFEVPAGSITAVIGPNGSGKSTLLNAIAGLMEPSGGELQVAARGDDAHRVAYVLQTTKVNDVLPISVKEVVTMGRYPRSGWYRPIDLDDNLAIDQAMARVDITELSSRHLQHLSGGQRQRVFMAQGLAQDHDLMLLDEPLTGIDLVTAQAIDEVIHEEIEQGCTVIMTTHDLSEARFADYVLLLSGRVVASGPPSEVLTTENLTEAYGQALLHMEPGAMFVDDPAHQPVPGRHLHRDRIIHTEPSQDQRHGDH